MVRVRKEVWRPGKYVLADGREWTDTAEDIRNGHRQGSDMLAAGLNLPLCWEHQSQAVPTYLSDLDWSDSGKAAFARSVFGKVAGYELEDQRTPDGNTEPVLFGLLDIPDDKDAEQFKKTAFVSPRLDTNYRDSKGRVWPGKTVSHVAATPVPVQTGQAPAELSKLLGTSDGTVYLSQLKPKGGVNPLGGGRSMEIGKVAELLRKVGIDLGQPRNDGEFMAALEAAVRTKCGSEGGDMGQNGNDPNVDYANSPPALMSQLPEPLQKRAKELLEVERKDWVRRIDDLFKSGRIDGPMHRELTAHAKTAELSYGPGWKLAETAEWMTDVRAFEKLRAGLHHDAGGNGKSADLSRAGVVERPDTPTPSADGDDRAAREKAAGDAIMAGFVGFEKKG